MSNPTRQEIIEAHDALTTLYARAMGVAPSRALRERILAALPPRPQPTMAEVEWDDELHYLAEAEHPVWRTVIMLGLDEEKLIEVFVPHLRECRYRIVRREAITPTGKRYTLTEVQE